VYKNFHHKSLHRNIFFGHLGGGIISKPYFGAVTKAFSMFAGLTVGGEGDRSSTGTPISAKNVSNPAGVFQHSILAGFDPMFLKL
jgi:hypothetical protein